MTDRNNPVLDKSYRFALAVIPVASKLQQKGEFVLSRQLVRSGTAVGALVEEAQAAQTKPDFRTKMCVAEKEARECHYWLRLLRDSKQISQDTAESLLADCQELKRLLAAITKTTANNISH